MNNFLISDRPYEVSIWTIQNAFIATLKSMNVNFEGQLRAPTMSVRMDGTKTFECDIPMVYYNFQTGQRVDNPLYYNVQQGNIVVNVRKIRIIFDKATYDSKVHEFLITEVTETHDEQGILMCHIKAEGIAFHELGKIGNEIVLDIDTVEREYLEKLEAAEKADLPIPVFPKTNINYWLNKVFPNHISGGKTIWDSEWQYRIEMDWSDFPGGGRLPTVIYEDEHNEDWTLEFDRQGAIVGATPVNFSSMVEKERTVDAKNSNIYNITQTIAETFGVFCRYEYIYDKQYNPKSKTCVFYNEGISDDDLVVTYGNNMSSFSRTLDTTNIFSKIFVEDIDSEYMDDGVVSIKNSASNLSREGSILNFDYFYNTGAINKEQYDEIPRYEYAMREFNNALEANLSEQTVTQTLLNDLETERTMRNNARLAADTTSNNLSADKETFIKTAGTSEPGLSSATARLATVLTVPAGEVQYVGSARATHYVNIRDRGVIASSVRIYRGKNTSGQVINQIPSGNYSFHYSETGSPNIIYFTEGVLTQDGTVVSNVFLTYNFDVLTELNQLISFYQTISRQATGLLEIVERNIKATENRRDELEEKYKEIAQEKEERRKTFDKMMGMALREGTWNGDNQQDPGENFKWTFPDTANASRASFEMSINKFASEFRGYTGELFGGKNQLDLSRLITSGPPTISSISANAVTLQSTNPTARTHRSFRLTNLLVGRTYTISGNMSNTTLGFIGIDEFDNSTDARTMNNAKTFTVRPGHYYFLQLYTNITSTTYSGSVTITYSQLQLEEGRNATSFEAMFAGAYQPNNYIIVPSALKTSINLEKLVFEVTTSAPNILSFGSEFYPVYIYPTGFIFLFHSFSLNLADIKSIKYYFSSTPQTTYTLSNSEWRTFTPYTADIAYPRIVIKDKNIRTESASFGIDNNSNRRRLTNFEDYQILKSGGLTYATIKINANTTIADIESKLFGVQYRASRANEHYYFDALQVAYDSCMPVATYEAAIANLPNYWKISSFDIGRLVYINDLDMNLRSVRGYISEYTLDLAEPVNDSFVIQNYKTRFEDLFSRIVASSEIMKTQSYSFERAGNAFNVSGYLKGGILQTSLDSNQIAFNFSSANVFITEHNGIEIINTYPYSNGVLGMIVLKGGGIFLSDSVDSSGNRIWNTAILPTGINASLIRTGRLDTNLINIYSGDNLRFTWKSDGLYAFAQSLDGTPNMNHFVRFSEDGLLFQNGLTANSEPIITGRLDWEGLTLYAPSEGGASLTPKEGLRIYDEAEVLRLVAGKFEIDNIAHYGLALYKRISTTKSIPSMVTSSDGDLWLMETMTIGSGNNYAGLRGYVFTKEDFLRNVYESRFYRRITLVTTYTSWTALTTAINNNVYLVPYDENNPNAMDVAYPDITSEDLQRANPQLFLSDLYTGNMVNVPIAARGITPESQSPRIWAGNNEPYIPERLMVAPFMVTQDGSLFASNATVTGTIFANAGRFTGRIEAQQGWFYGDVYADNGRFRGEVTATSGWFSGRIVVGSEWKGEYEDLSLIPSETNVVYISGGPRADPDVPVERIVATGTEGATFILYDDGSIIATRATLSGDITAFNGKFLGDVLIGENGSSGINGDSENNYILMWIGASRFIPGTNDFDRTSARFYVTNDGTLYSKNLYLSGEGHIQDYLYVGPSSGDFYFNGINGREVNGRNAITTQLFNSYEEIDLAYGFPAGTTEYLNPGLSQFFPLEPGAVIRILNNNPLRLWLGATSPDYDNAAFRVYNNGDVYASNLTLTKNLQAQDVRLNGVLYLGNTLVLDGINNYVGTQTFVPNLSGWKIDDNGDAYFNNAIFRGKIQSTIFETKRVSSIGGDVYVSPSISTTTDILYQADDLENYYYVSDTQPRILTIVYTHACTEDEAIYWNVEDEVVVDGFANRDNNQVSIANSDFSDMGKSIGTVTNIEEIRTDEILEAITITIEFESSLGLVPNDNAYICRPLLIVNKGSTNNENSHIYLTARGPYIQMAQRSPTQDKNINITQLGNLSGIRDEVFGLLEGHGLYSENAYLRGNLFTPYAGFSSLTLPDRDNIRIWAGSVPGDAAENAPFRVYESGRVVALDGEFAGKITAINSIFSGYISASAIVIKHLNPRTAITTQVFNNYSELDTHFNLASGTMAYLNPGLVFPLEIGTMVHIQQDYPTQFKPELFIGYDRFDSDGNILTTADNLVASIDGSGFSIFEGGFRVFSDWAAGYRNDSINPFAPEPGVAYIRPYGSADYKDSSTMYPYVAVNDTFMTLNAYKGHFYQMAHLTLNTYSYLSTVISNGNIKFGKGQVIRNNYYSDQQSIFNATNFGFLGLSTIRNTDVMTFAASANTDGNRKILFTSYTGSDGNSSLSVPSTLTMTNQALVGINVSNLDDIDKSLAVFGSVKIFENINHNAELQIGGAKIVQVYNSTNELENGIDIFV